jgi:hypothetical protein
MRCLCSSNVEYVRAARNALVKLNYLAEICKESTKLLPPWTNLGLPLHPQSVSPHVLVRMYLIPASRYFLPNFFALGYHVFRLCVELNLFP